MGRIIARTTVQNVVDKEKSPEFSGPVRIQIEGFPSCYSEVFLLEMEPGEGDDEILLGYIPLEQSRLAVDMPGHRLVAA